MIPLFRWSFPCSRLCCSVGSNWQRDCRPNCFKGNRRRRSGRRTTVYATSWTRRRPSSLRESAICCAAIPGVDPDEEGEDRGEDSTSIESAKEFARLRAESLALLSKVGRAI